MTSAGLDDAAFSPPRKGDLLLELAPFFLGSALVANVIHLGVPALVARGIPALGAWMALAIPFVFLPLLLIAALLLRAEAPGRVVERLRLQAPTRRDWLVGGCAVVLLVALSGALMLLARWLGWAIHPPTVPPPPPLAGRELWLLVGLWLVYWPLNILGEELLWRGVLLPRMEARFGRHAWAPNGALWLVFHLAFGPGNLLVLLPTLFLVPLVAQRRRSTWLGVLLHATLSGPGFVAMALGLPS